MAQVVEPDMSFHRAIIDAAESQRLARAYAGVQAEIQLCMVQLRPRTTAPPRSPPSTTELLGAIVDGGPAPSRRGSSATTSARPRSELSDSSRRESDASEGEVIL